MSMMHESPRRVLNASALIGCSTNVESLDVDHDAEERLNCTDGQHRDVTPASPEEPAQARDDCPGNHENQEESEDMMLVRERTITANRPRCKKMSEEANANENYT
jgi:hypothetical protein